jgi:hypothetical protein
LKIGCVGERSGRRTIFTPDFMGLSIFTYGTHYCSVDDRRWRATTSTRGFESLIFATWALEGDRVFQSGWRHDPKRRDHTLSYTFEDSTNTAAPAEPNAIDLTGTM